MLLPKQNHLAHLLGLNEKDGDEESGTNRGEPSGQGVSVHRFSHGVNRTAQRQIGIVGRSFAGTLFHGPFNGKHNSRLWELCGSKMLNVAASLHQQLGWFLRKERGALTYQQFARKVGVSKSTLHRMELGEQNVTLETLEQLTKRLKCSLSDIFP